MSTEIQRTQGEWLVDESRQFFSNRVRVNISKTSQPETDLTTIFVVEDYTEITGQAIANAKYICAAVNNHQALLDALKRLVKDVRNKPNDTRYETHLKIAEAAIAAAEQQNN